MKKSSTTTTVVSSYKRTSTSSTQNYFEVSPKRKMNSIEAEEEEERPVLMLKPFAAKPQISFKNVLINKEISQYLYIYNPDPVDITAEFVNIPPVERHLHLSTTSLVVGAKSEVAVLLTWTPKEPGTWWDTLTVKDSKGRRGAVSISYECVLPKQPKGFNRGFRRGVGSTTQSRPGSKQVAKPAVKPQWRAPTLPKPAPREVLRQQQQPVAPADSWKTFDAHSAQELTNIELPSTPLRRETYNVQDGLRKSTENKENDGRSTTTNTKMESASTSFASPGFTMQTRSMAKKSGTPLLSRLAHEELNLSKDSLESPPAKQFQPKSKLLDLLDAVMFSPCVIKPQSSIPADTFLENTNADNDFTNIASFSEMSFANRRCSTAFKQIEKKPHLELSPRRGVSPRELFSNQGERRLSSDTYVVSASNSLEGASGESILAVSTSPGPCRLSRVAEVTEQAEDWSMQFQDQDTGKQVELHVLPEEDLSGVEVNPSLLSEQASGDGPAENVPSILYQDESATQDNRFDTYEVLKQHSVSQIEDIPQHETFDISPPNKQTTRNLRETFDVAPPCKFKEQVLEFSPPQKQVTHNLRETFVVPPPRKNKQLDHETARQTFEISPPHQQSSSHKQKVKVHETFEVTESCTEEVEEVFVTYPPEKQFDENKVSSSTTYTHSSLSSTSFLSYSPPKPFRLPKVNWSNESSTSHQDIKNNTYVKTKDVTSQNKTTQVVTSSQVFVPVGITKPLKLQETATTLASTNPVREEQNMSGEQIHDPDLFLYEYATLYATAPGIKQDPFHLNPMLSDAWLEKCDVEFKQWLNAVLTPPEELDTVEAVKVDAATLWARSTKAGANQQLAPSRELVSSRYLAVKSRLDQLRRAALNLFVQPQVAEVLCKTACRVDSNNIKMRQDKQLHLDQGLKQNMLMLFLSYNPLWLRLGLETVIGRTIPLESNSDIHGLSNFLVNRLLSVEAVVGKSHLILKQEYKEKFNRFVLKKFLWLVYFLDQAKTRKLIRHDPCLFRRKSDIKSSKEMLLAMSRLLLAGEGDLTKHLGYMGYTVTHKQGYLDEYSYEVSRLGVDLRDGVRITRVVELVTGTSGLSGKLRVPPVSRLQKIYNVELALGALEKAGYAVQNVKAVDIVGGHREKTLSMLWQIVHNFQAPRIDKAARFIQKLWLRPKLHAVISRRIYQRRRQRAAIIFQKLVRGYLCRKRFEKLKLAAKVEKHHNAMATIIQKNWRIFMMTKKLNFLARYGRMSKAVVIIQSQVRMILAKSKFQALKVEAELRTAALQEAAAVKIQSFWRRVLAKRLLMQLKQEEEHRRHVAAIKVQTLFRCIQAKKVLHQLRYEAKREVSALTLQCAWRKYQAKKILETLRQELEVKRQYSAVIIQCAWRVFVAKKVFAECQAERVWQRNAAALTLQCAWRCFVAKKALVQLQIEYRQIQEKSALKIQCAWRIFTAKKTLTLLRLDYQTRKEAATTIQCAWRQFSARKVLCQLRQEKELKRHQATLKIQCCWRSYMARRTLAQLKRDLEAKRQAASITIQCAWRSLVARSVLKQLKMEYEEKRNMAALNIQCWWRCSVAKQTLSELKKEYETRQTAAITIQCAWRQFVAKKILTRLQREHEEKRNCAALKIQCLWRCYMAKTTLFDLRAKHEAKLQVAALTLQCAWRQFSAKKALSQLQIENEEKRNRAALNIQCLWKCYQAKQVLLELRREHETCKQAAIKIQCAWRQFLARKILIELQFEYEDKRNCAALQIQCFWRSYAAKKQLHELKLQFVEKNESALKIQCAWRCFVAKNTFLQLRKAHAEKCHHAAIKLQCLWRSHVARKTLTALKLQYDLEARAATTIQCAWRQFSAKKVLCQLRQENELKRHQATLKIQCCWRSYIARKTLAQLKRDLEAKRQAASITIQCAWRSLVARSVLKQLKTEYEEKRNMAALNIQCWWRCSVAKQTLSELKKEYETHQTAAITIQCAWRQFMAKKILTRLQREHEEKRNCAALKIQCLWRCYMAKTTLFDLRAKHEAKLQVAALTLQCAWRQFSAKKVLSELQIENEEKRNCAALKIQYLWRCFVAKRILFDLRAKHEAKLQAAALTLQCAWRQFSAKKILTRLQREHEEKRNCAALKIQCLWRCFVAKTTLFDLRAKHEAKLQAAALTLQCAWRQFSAKKILVHLRRELKEKRNKSALKIQCIWRCYKANQILKTLKHEHETKIHSAILIQCAWKQHVARKRLLELKREREVTQNCAAVKIQCWWRCYIARCELSRLRHEREITRVQAAILLQANWRKVCAKKHLLQLKTEALQKKHTAATKIKTAWKTYVAKKCLAQLKAEALAAKNNNLQQAKRSAAAQVIQGAFRRWIWKQAVMRLKIEKQVGYTPHNYIQAWEEHLFTGDIFSSNVALAILQEQRCMNKRELQAALTIQYFWKQHINKKHQAATKIQALWRGYHRRCINHSAAQAKQPVTIKATNTDSVFVFSAELVTKVVEQHQRIQEATVNALANVENRIAYKIELALSQLGKTMGHDIYAMSIFENYLSLTDTCIPLILPALPYILNLLKRNNRSVPAMEVALPASGALLSLAKHPFSQPTVWENEELISTLIFTLTICKDTNEKVFFNACTTLWLMARQPQQRQEILSQEKIAYRLKNLMTHIQGRERIKSNKKSQTPPVLPSLRYNKKPLGFTSRLFGIQTVMKLLGLPVPNK